MSEIWYIAVEPFDTEAGDRWVGYVEWSGLTHLNRLISLDSILCPPILSEILISDWDHCVNADFLTDYFTDLDYLLTRIPAGVKHHVYAVVKSPSEDLSQWRFDDRFQFMGYDLVDRMSGPSALSNCGGFPEIFQPTDLSSDGLLLSFQEALRIQSELRRLYPHETHADCNIWGIWLMLEASSDRKPM